VIGTLRRSEASLATFTRVTLRFALLYIWQIRSQRGACSISAALRHVPPIVRGNLISCYAGTVMLTAHRMRNHVIAEEISMRRQHTAHWNPPPHLSPLIAAAADAVRDLEFQQGKTQENYAAAAKALGQPLHKGAIPFQDIDRLFKLRDALMHMHPARPSENHTSTQVADELAARGIALQNGPHANFAWYDRVGTAEVARWAGRSALTLVFAIPAGVPPSASPIEPLPLAPTLYQRPLFADETWT
jgi:hypothetical protein